jgi:hypothetical protein
MNEFLTEYCKESFLTATPNPLDLDSTVAHVLKRANTDVPPVAF